MESWAIIVGINEHPGLAGLRELHGAVADAADFAEWCLDPAGGNVPPDRLYFWSYPKPTLAEAGPRLSKYLKKPSPWPHPRAFIPLKPDMRRAPMSGEVKALARDISRAASRAAPQRVYIHFAGHGVQLEKDGETDTCFLTGDYVFGGGMVPCAQMSRSLQTFGIAEVVLFLDCCRSPLNSMDQLPLLFEMGAFGKSHGGIGHAAAPGLQSFEFPDEPPKRGAFTKVLTDGLRTERNARGELTFDGLGSYVLKQVPVILGKAQEPQFALEPPSRPMVIVTGAVAPRLRKVTADFPLAQQGKTFRVAGSGPASEPLPAPFVAGATTHTFEVVAGQAFALVCDEGPIVRPFGPEENHVL